MRLALLTVLLFVAAGFTTSAAESTTTATTTTPEPKTKPTAKPTPESKKNPKTKPKPKPKSKPQSKLKEPKWKRRLDIKMTSRRVKIDAKSDFEEKTEEGKDKRKDDIKFDIEGKRDGLELDLEYKYSGETDTTRSKFSIKYKFAVESIIEFVPTDITKGFQQGTDTIVQEVKLEEWSTMVRGTTTLGEGDSASEVDTFTIKGGKQGGATLFTSKGHISTNTLNDLDYSSNYVKFGYDIDKFPYQGKDTALAIRSKIKGKFKRKTKTKGTKRSGKVQEYVKFQNEAVELPEDSPFGRFSWVTTAQADGQTVDIIAATQEDAKDGNSFYFFAFNTVAQPASISWDPDVGVGYPGDDADESENVSAGARSSCSLMLSLAAIISFLSQLF